LLHKLITVIKSYRPTRCPWAVGMLLDAVGHCWSLALTHVDGLGSGHAEYCWLTYKLQQHLADSDSGMPALCTLTMAYYDARKAIHDSFV